MAILVTITSLAILIAVFSDRTEQPKAALIWVGGVSLLFHGDYVYRDQKRGD